MATYEENINEGTVSFEDAAKKPGEGDPQYWLSTKARVELSFQVFEGEEGSAVLEYVGNVARAQVGRLLGTAAPATAETPASPPARRTRRTAAQIAADEAAKKSGSTAGSSSGAPPTGANTGGANSGDAADIEDPTGGEEHVVHLPDESGGDFDIEAPAEETFDIEPKEDATVEITDADLNSAVQKKNAEITNPNAIRALISSYNPDPKAGFQLRQIDKAKRAEFIAKLAKLTKESKAD